MFAKETYTTRRNSLKKSLGTGLLLFLGNEESGMNYEDNTYHFRQDSTFLYFSACPMLGWLPLSMWMRIRKLSSGMS